jgi:TRAM domain
VPVDRFEVLGKGTLESLVEAGPEAGAKAEGKQIELKLGEVGRHDVKAGVGKLDGLTVCVGDASGLIGKKAKVRIERVLDGTAYATLVRKVNESDEPITAESAAEKPTRKPPTKKQAEPVAEIEVAEPEPEADVEQAEPEAEPETEAEPEAEAKAEAEPAAVAEGQAPKKKTRRGSRGGKRRRKKPAGVAADGKAPQQPSAEGNGEGPKIHLPDPGLGREEPEEVEETAVDEAKAQDQDGGQAQPKKKTRRGSRGGRRRRKPASQSSSGSSE